MYIKELVDVKIIKEFLIEPELWERISEYGQNKEDFEIVLHEHITWIGFYEKDLLVGILLIHPLNGITCQVHINIHRQHREQYSGLIAILVKEYLLTTNYNKFNTSVPEIYPDVCKYLERNGFIVEGIDRESINTHNGVIDQINYGITRNELKAFCVTKSSIKEL